MQYKY